MGVRCSQSKGRQVADLHFPLPELQRLHKAAGEDRAGHPERSYLLDRRQPQHPQERSAQGVAHRASPDRARLHPQGGGMAEYDRGMVAAIPAAGASRDRFRRQLRDRLCEEGRYSPVESQSEAVGVGTTSKAAETWEAHFCVPSLRNGAVCNRKYQHLGRASCCFVYTSPLPFPKRSSVEVVPLKFCKSVRRYKEGPSSS